MSEPTNGGSLPGRVLVAPLESALDYLTCTGRTTEHRHALRAIGHQFIRELQADGHDSRPFNWKGYEGETCEWATWGERDDGAMLRISGPWSAEYFDLVYPLADNVSRIDLAVTAALPFVHADLAADAYRSACAAARLRGKALKVKYVTDSDGGSTVYLGSRKSELFARLYNKEAESKREEYKHCWRWELEAKGSTAKHYAEYIASTTSRPGLIAGTVADYFAKRGAPANFDSHDCTHIRPLPLEKSDDDRRMEWFRQQVAPIVGRMSARVGRGRMLEALGLTVDTSSGSTAPSPRTTFAGGGESTS